MSRLSNLTEYIDNRTIKAFKLLHLWESQHFFDMVNFFIDKDDAPGIGGYEYLNKEAFTEHIEKRLSDPSFQDDLNEYIKDIE